MFKLERLSFGYNAHSKIIEDFSLNLAHGEKVALMGASGCGKSTLLRVLMGAESGGWQTGDIEFDGQKNALNKWQNDANDFSIVTQVPHLLPWKSVYDNLALVCAREGAKAAQNKVHELLKIVGLEAYANYYPFQISHGMASRISFVRSMLLKSRVVLADEPFAALDAFTRRRMQQWFCESELTKGLSSIFVTHDVDEAKRIATRIIIIGGKPARCVAELRAHGTNSDGERIWDKNVDEVVFAWMGGEALQ